MQLNYRFLTEIDLSKIQLMIDAGFSTVIIDQDLEKKDRIVLAMR